jgi:hypothetical protein
MGTSRTALLLAALLAAAAASSAAASSAAPRPALVRCGFQFVHATASAPAAQQAAPAFGALVHAVFDRRVFFRGRSLDLLLLGAESDVEEPTLSLRCAGLAAETEARGWRLHPVARWAALSGFSPLALTHDAALFADSAPDNTWTAFLERVDAHALEADAHVSLEWPESCWLRFDAVPLAVEGAAAAAFTGECNLTAPTLAPVLREVHVVHVRGERGIAARRQVASLLHVHSATDGTEENEEEEDDELGAIPRFEEVDEGAAAFQTADGAAPAASHRNASKTLAPPTIAPNASNATNATNATATAADLEAGINEWYRFTQSGPAVRQKEQRSRPVVNLLTGAAARHSHYAQQSAETRRLDGKPSAGAGAGEGEGEGGAWIDRPFMTNVRADIPERKFAPREWRPLSRAHARAPVHIR